MPVLTRTLARGRDRARPASHATTSWWRSPTAPIASRAVAGPFARYERTPAHRRRTASVTETIDYELAPMVWSFPFARLYRLALLPPGSGTDRGGRPRRRPTPRAPPRSGRSATLAARLRLHRHAPHARRSRSRPTSSTPPRPTRAPRWRAVRIGVLGALALTDAGRPQGPPARAARPARRLGCLVAALSASRPTWSRSASRRPSCAGWRPPAACWW